MRGAVLLSTVWFLLLGGLGTFFPFYSLYLKENAGLDGARVGMVLAMIPLVGMIAQPLWGQLADRTGARVRTLLIATLGEAAGFAVLWHARGFGELVAATALLAAFSTAVIPLCVSVSMAHLSPWGHQRFGYLRVWGTIGFLCTVVALPFLLTAAGDVRWQPVRETIEAGATMGASEPALGLMLPVTTACCLLAAAFLLCLPDRGKVTVRAARGEWRILLAHPPFVRALAFFFFAYLFLQGPMALFPIYVRALGGNVETVSRMWVVMLSLEIPLVALSGAGFRRLGGRGLLAVGVVSGAVRWLVCGLVDDVGWIYPVQILHGITVVGLMVGGPLYIEAVVPETLRSTGQGMFSMVGVSLGGIVSTVASGWLVDRFSATAPALVGGCGALALSVVLPWLVPPASRPAEAASRFAETEAIADSLAP